LENEGTGSSQGSHWERAVFYDELMTATTMGSVKHLSGLTLALLEDMGWYTVDTYEFEGISFGKGKGCDFYNNACYSSSKHE
jgi:proprotein convertase subtilisin/kexin type 5